MSSRSGLPLLLLQLGLEIDEFSRERMEVTQKELEEERDAVAKI